MKSTRSIITITFLSLAMNSLFAGHHESGSSHSNEMTAQNWIQASYASKFIN